MNSFRTFALAAVAGIGLTAFASQSQAQIAINIGVPPVCPYGYFDYAPYACAPWGYYGPEWFINGAFIGAGPWFHGPAGFHGYVNNRYAPEHGFHGALPQHGARAAQRPGAVAHFKGNEMRDGRGHVMNGRRH